MLQQLRVYQGYLKNQYRNLFLGMTPEVVYILANWLMGVAPRMLV